MAGSAASALSSAVTTPFDVVKTRIASGTLPPKSPILPSLVRIARQEGMRGLYAGVKSRIVLAALFGGIGFTSFETFKVLLRVEEPKVAV